MTDPTQRPASSSEIGEVVAEMRKEVTVARTMVILRCVDLVTVSEWADRLAAIAQRPASTPAPECEGGQAVAWQDMFNRARADLRRLREAMESFCDEDTIISIESLAAAQILLEEDQPIPPADPVRREARLRELVLAALPTNWLDELLSGPNAALSDNAGKWGCPDIERLLSAIKRRVEAALGAAGKA